MVVHQFGRRYSRALRIALFLSPTIAVFLLIYAAPIIMMVVTSFTQWTGFDTPKFVGLKNFRDMITMPVFHRTLLNCLAWGGLAAAIHVPFGVLIALVLNRRPFGWRTVRAVTMLPNIIPAAALALMYVFVFNPGIGLLNQLVRALGFQNFTVYWLQDTRYAFWAITMVFVFYSGVIVLITMAELAAVEEDVVQAAVIDGASPFQIDLFINLPALRNIIVVGLIIAVTDTFKMFEYIYLTTRGGPNQSTLNLGVMVYFQATAMHRAGFANALGIVLLALGIVVILFLNMFSRKD